MKMNVNGKDCINLATFNFLGFVGRKEIEVRSIVNGLLCHSIDSQHTKFCINNS